MVQIQSPRPFGFVPKTNDLDAVGSTDASSGDPPIPIRSCGRLDPNLVAERSHRIKQPFFGKSVEVALPYSLSMTR